MASDRHYTTVSVSKDTANWLRELRDEREDKNLEQTVSHVIGVYDEQK